MAGFYAEYSLDRFLRSYCPNKNHGVFLEVGAGGPDYLSVSKHFRESGWFCVGFDANPKFCEMHRNLGLNIQQYAISSYNAEDISFYIVHQENKPEFFGGVVTEEGGSSLNPVWQTKRPDSGYVEEIKVPVRTLNWIVILLHLTLRVERWMLCMVLMYRNIHLIP